MSEKIVDCNADNFEILSGENYLSRDKNKVFFKEKTITGADPSSFISDEKIGKNYFEDKNAIYYKYIMIEKVDRNSFKTNTNYSVADSRRNT